MVEEERYLKREHKREGAGERGEKERGGGRKGEGERGRVGERIRKGGEILQH